MKVYIVAIVNGKYMMPQSKVYVNLKSAQKKCDKLNAEDADNWGDV